MSKRRNLWATYNKTLTLCKNDAVLKETHLVILFNVYSFRV